jgi:hypothetical protein
MFTINLTTVTTAAVFAIGLVAASDLALSRTEPTAAATVSARFPTQAEMMVALQDNPPVQLRNGQADKALVPAAACVREHWPYLADECLVAPDGAPVKRPSRTITIERRIAGDAAPLLQVSEVVIR